MNARRSVRYPMPTAKAAGYAHSAQQGRINFVNFNVLSNDPMLIYQVPA